MMRVWRRRLLFGVLLAWAALLLTGCPERIVDTEEEDPDINPPLVVETFDAEAGAGNVLLTWGIAGEDNTEDLDEDLQEDLQDANEDLEGVLIVRATGDYPDALPVRSERYQVGDALGAGVVIANLSRHVKEFVDEDVTIGGVYYYEAIAYDEVPNYAESARAAAAPGSLVWARLAHTQTTLADDRVLLAGGIGHAGPLDRAEIFDPATERFTAVQNRMHKERFSQTATLLDDGRVLLVGGYEEGFAQTLNSAEIFDPDDETFSLVDDRMEIGRALHTATPLPDGRVLIAGGSDGVNALDTLEVFDPATLTFTLLADVLPNPRYGHTAAVSGDEVIIFGGFDGFQTLPGAVAVRLDNLRVTDLQGIPDHETPMQAGRLNATLTELADGRWLIAGGFSGTLSGGAEVATAELFAPAGDPYFAFTGSLLQARSGHRAAALADGTVLICGGIADQVVLESAELYQPDQETFVGVGALNSPRTVPEIGRLPDGRVLVTGGNRSVDLFAPDPAATAELYDPDTQSFAVVGAP